MNFWESYPSFVIGVCMGMGIVLVSTGWLEGWAFIVSSMLCIGWLEGIWAFIVSSMLCIFLMRFYYDKKKVAKTTKVATKEVSE